jgi:tRNA(Ile)-lysidine synthase
MRPVERAEGGLLLVRPLLAERRAAVAAYAAARGLAWCEDPTNDAAHPAGAAWLRNRVRHTLLPAWTALFGDGGVARLAELAALLGDERDLTAALLAAHEGTWWRRLPDADPRAAPAGVALDATALARQPAALRRHALVHALDLLGRRTGFTRRHVDALAALAGSTAGSAALDLPGGLAARRAYGALVLSRTAGRPVGGDGAPHAGASAPVTPDGALSAVDRTALVVPGPGRYTLGAAALHVRRDPAAPGGRPDPTREAWFAATPEAFPLRLRPPRRGERLALALAAGVGHRPVARVLVDRKVPRAQRGAALLLVDGADAPLWLLLSGGRPADPEPAAGSGPGPGGGDVATPGASGMSALPERFAPTQGLLRTALRPVRPGVGPVVRVSLTPPA